MAAFVRPAGGTFRTPVGEAINRHWLVDETEVMRELLPLARLPEARAAFDKVLAIDPANRASSCGALDVARKQGRAKDADALGRAMKAAAIDCVDAPQVAEAAAVSVGSRARR